MERWAGPAGTRALMLPILSGAFMCYRSGVCRVQLRPQSLSGIRDLIVQHAQPTLILWGVGYIAADRRVRGGTELDRLARASRVAYHAHPDYEIIAIATEHFESLLSGISYQWNFHCWDAPRAPLPSALARQADAAANVIHRVEDVPALH